MIDARTSLILEIERRLGPRRLVWIGTRGADARPLLALEHTEAVCSLIAPLEGSMIRSQLCLEESSQRRVNLDAYDFDEDGSVTALLFRREIRRLVQHRCVLVPYRALRFISTVSYPGRDLVEVFGLFAERQRAFEHKPWVESGLRGAEVPTIDWTYYSTDDSAGICEALGATPSVLRGAHSSGGSGLAVVRTPAEVTEFLSRIPEGFVALSRLLTPSLPININACVFAGGTVTLHNLSAQLIGVQQCTRLPFGYCGNDFALPRGLEPKVLNRVAEVVRRVGRWLAGEGYRGAFGVDALIHEGRTLVSEVNPRFQGSSELSARIDSMAGRVDLYLAHLAAFLDLPVADEGEFSDRVLAQRECAQVLLHNTLNIPGRGISGEFGKRRGEPTVELTPSSDVLVDPGGIRGRVMIERKVTIDGTSVQWDNIGSPSWRGALGLSEGARAR